jgi:hypothetical protein
MMMQSLNQITVGDCIITNETIRAMNVDQQQHFLVVRDTPYLVIAIIDKMCLCLFAKPVCLGHFPLSWVQDDLDNPYPYSCGEMHA